MRKTKKNANPLCSSDSKMEKPTEKRNTDGSPNEVSNHTPALQIITSLQIIESSDPLGVNVVKIPLSGSSIVSSVPQKDCIPKNLS